MRKEENLHWLDVEIQTWENECQSKHPIKEALYEARKALEQKPCKDAVSRQAVIDMTGLSEWFDSSDSYNEFVIALSELPSVTPQLSVPEVTALAEWIEKLTKECEEAYNKGYADGVKSVNICPHCGEYIGEEE